MDMEISAAKTGKSGAYGVVVRITQDLVTKITTCEHEAKFFKKLMGLQLKIDPNPFPTIYSVGILDDRESWAIVREYVKPLPKKFHVGLDLEMGRASRLHDEVSPKTFWKAVTDLTEFPILSPAFTVFRDTGTPWEFVDHSPDNFGLRVDKPVWFDPLL